MGNEIQSELFPAFILYAAFPQENELVLPLCLATRFTLSSFKAVRHNPHFLKPTLGEGAPQKRHPFCRRDEL